MKGHSNFMLQLPGLFRGISTPKIATKWETKVVSRNFPESQLFQADCTHFKYSPHSLVNSASVKYCTVCTFTGQFSQVSGDKNERIILSSMGCCINYNSPWPPGLTCAIYKLNNFCLVVGYFTGKSASPTYKFDSNISNVSYTIKLFYNLQVCVHFGEKNLSMNHNLFWCNYSPNWPQLCASPGVINAVHLLAQDKEKWRYCL